MNNVKPPTILVIIGITGDLAKRKLLPAIEKIAAANELPKQFKIIGISRRDTTIQEVLDELPKGTATDFIAKHLQMYRMSLENHTEYVTLKNDLDKIAAGFDAQTQYLFYLSVPPQVSRSIIDCIGMAGFCKDSSTKLLLEKPFGSDLISAQELISQIQQYFKEEQIYRIDHYLAKEMAQNILVFRAGNSLFKRSWNKDFIERIEIIASEKLGIEGRATFYEQTGALRDLVQSHLLQLAALTLMDLPPDGHWDEVPKYRLEALRQLNVARSQDYGLKVRRGQYRGYEEEVKNPHTKTETFLSLELASTDPRWEGVPITLATGKALDRKCTEVRIHYRQEAAGEANQLVLRIQPKEGIEFAIWSKRPGYGRETESVELQFDYNSKQDALPEAYEQVFLSAIQSDHTLFTSSDEVLASWRVLEPVQAAWAMSSNDLVIYDQGTSIESLTK